MQEVTTRRPGGAWWVYGLGAALILVAARFGLLYRLEHLHHGVPVDIFLRRFASALPAVIGLALAAGLGGALATRLLARASTGRRLAFAAVALGAGALGAALVVGSIGSDGLREHQLGRETTQGLVATAVVAAASLLLAGLLVAAVQRNAAQGGAAGRGRFVLAAAIVLVLLLLPFGARALGRSLRPPLVLAEVVLDVPASEGVWEAFGEAAGFPQVKPSAGMLTPSPMYELDGAGMRSLLVPPGTSVEFSSPEDQGHLWLVARAGYGPRLVLGAQRRKQRAVARFTVEVDGEEVWSHENQVFGKGPTGASEWTDVGGERGILLAPGARVRLATELMGADGEPYPWKDVRDGGMNPKRGAMLSSIGFGSVVLERRRHIPRERSSPDKPNVVFIVMDTLRADRLSTYGYERPTSPHLDALAARGLLAERAYSTASWTWPSTASLFTGRLPEEHGVVSHNACFLEYGYDTLTEALAREGVSTGAFSANPLIVPDKNFDQGFEVFFHGKAGILDSGQIMPGALDWIEEHAGERFYAYIHLTDPHAPLKPLAEARALLAPDVPEDFSAVACNKIHGRALSGAGRDAEGHLHLDKISAPEERQWINDLYDACVRSGDERLGEVLDTLERLGLTDETIIAFTSDHGEELFDHGFVTHGQSVHQELMTVPLVLAGPGIPAGARLTEPLSNRHLAPTLARLAGGELEGGFKGFDLVERLDADAAEDVLMFHTSSGWWGGNHPVQIYGLQSGKLVLHWAPWTGNWGEPKAPLGGSWRLFDLAADPDELLDLAGEQSEDALALRRQLTELRVELEKRKVDAADVGVGEDTLRMLRAIGYIGDE